MCLAEALLRVPDKDTKTRLIRDKISSVEWGKRFTQKGASEETFFSKLTGFGLATADHLMHWGLERKGFLDALGGITRRVSEPIIRQSIAQAMKILGHQFVMGETIEDALRRSKEAEKNGYCYSYDMLGEAACTKEDAHRYYEAYAQSIEKIGKEKRECDIFTRPGIWIKL